jgi:hypothetical protein
MARSGGALQAHPPAPPSIIAVKYYTAMVSGRANDPGAPTRQQTYLDALAAHCPEVEVTFGHFLANDVKMRLVRPINGQNFALVTKTEEKGSDVNLALHVLNDSWRDAMECAVIVSNDSDLAEALRLIKMQHRRKIILVTPGEKSVRWTNNQLKRWASAVRRITEADLSASQLPSPIPGTTVSKPPSW